ncbi:hypothetical protein ACFFF5_08525 [Lederbergia wuyishanensis]|uniref:Uncharacterized protein n=1 Tax=Lederbergia wuyishanensis TaxID=1347903 RepID=A0ABU0D6B9_9BACI|nr:hypothetical protein [Lederbergia wuyishanensis]MCJ8008647.1 hypothetical protein [Lederbergia wuyishanensis]MDQ0343935.1 hypothetical protein [Lederbergia wuyishanensis]
MNKVFNFVLLTSLFILLTGFSYQKHLKLQEVHTTINQAQKTIRYDLRIKNTSNKVIGNQFDYPGYHYGGLEVVVVPGEKLEKYMIMMDKTKYKKMQHSGFGGHSTINPYETSNFHAEYFFKDIKDLEKLKQHALDGKIIILDGAKVIAELQLKKE